MNIEEIALRLIESDCSVDIYFGILDKLEKHTTKIQELEKEKAHIEIAYEEDYKEQQQEIERLNNIITKAIEAINVYQNEKTLSVGYQDLKRIRGILRGNKFDLQMFEEYLKELGEKNENE